MNTFDQENPAHKKQYPDLLSIRFPPCVLNFIPLSHNAQLFSYAASLVYIS